MYALAAICNNVPPPNTEIGAADHLVKAGLGG